jgi:hypothetical protein
MGLAAMYAFLGVLGLSTLFSLRYWTARPTISKNYLTEWNAPALATPEDQRAWTLYRRADIELPLLPESFRVAGWPDIPLDHAEYADAVAYVESIAPQLELIRRGAALPTLGCVVTHRHDREWLRAKMLRNGRSEEEFESVMAEDTAKDPSDNPPLFIVLLPQLGVMREHARTLTFDMRLAAREKDPDRALADALAILGMAGQTRPGKSLIEQLVSNALLALACEQVGRVIQLHGDLWSDEQLQRLSQAISKHGGTGPIAFDWAGERETFLDLLQRMYTDNGEGDGRLVPARARGIANEIAALTPTTNPVGALRRQSVGEVLLGPWASQGIAGRKAQLAEYDRLMALWKAYGAKAPWTRTQADTTAMETQTRGIVNKMRYYPVMVMMPALRRSIDACEEITLIRDATLAGIACERYRRRLGVYPDTLAQLVPGELAAVPVDICTGRPILYRPSQSTVLLYSAGLDQDDDQAKFPPGNPLSGWSTTNAGPSDGDRVLWPVPSRSGKN